MWIKLEQIHGDIEKVIKEAIEEHDKLTRRLSVINSPGYSR